MSTLPSKGSEAVTKDELAIVIQHVRSVTLALTAAQVMALPPANETELHEAIKRALKEDDNLAARIEKLLGNSPDE